MTEDCFKFNGDYIIIVIDNQSGKIVIPTYRNKSSFPPPKAAYKLTT